MTTTDPRLSPDRVLASDADLCELLELLLRRANQRQLWLIMLDDDHRVVGPLMPLADYPSRPDDLDSGSELGTVSFSELLAHRFGMFVEAVEASEIVLVWERRGGFEFREDERAWAGAMARHCRGAGVRLRAQFILHSRGLRVLAPDDHG